MSRSRREVTDLIHPGKSSPDAQRRTERERRGEEREKRTGPGCSADWLWPGQDKNHTGDFI